MKKAAGILFISPSGNALFLKRAASAPDCAGCWSFPGGGIEEGETAEQAATRECVEEIGFLPDEVKAKPRVFHTRQISSSDPATGSVGHGTPPVPVAAGVPASPVPLQMPDVDFTTFAQRVAEEFVPTLNDEHDGWAWSPLASPPEPLHPGCRVAIDRLTMDELGVARAIASGQLTSPQRYENVTLWAIRITGTETAYRTKNDEFVYRRPEDYLNDEFLARCNGLPVIYKHPSTVILNSEEFGNRVVGTIFLPYVAGNEVWGIAKIYDDEANRDMDKLSTSPGVNFNNFGVNAKLTLQDGSKVLIEGKPSLFDHVAICELGVWDKGGEPSGIRSESRGDSAMTPEEKAKADAEAAEKAKCDAEAKAKADAEEKAKADADGGTALDKTLKAIGDTMKSVADSVGSLMGRMDSFEEKEKKRADAEEKMKADAEEEARKKGDPEQLKADKAKADAEEEEKKAKADAKEKEEKAKADSADTRRRIDEVAAMIPKSIGDADYAAIADAQARADDVFHVLGSAAPRPLQGETPGLYERRAARMLKEHSPTWKTVNIDGTAFADDAAFAIVRDQIYVEAKKTAMNPAMVPGGGLRMITKNSGGHQINEFVGSPDSWMGPMAGATRQYVTQIKTPNNVN